MNVLILGGTGYIGQKLVKKLLQEGHQVIVHSRSRGKVTSMWGTTVQSIEKFNELDALSIDWVYNFAGAPVADKRWSQSRKRELERSRIQLTDEAFAYFQKHKSPTLLVNASAVGFYGNQQDKEVTEESAPHNEYTHQLCKQWEESVNRFTALGTRVVILRLGVVIGKGSGFIRKLEPIYRLCLGGPLGSGKQWVSWVHVEDVVRFAAQAAETAWTGVYNLTSPEPVTNQQISDALGQVLNRPARLPAPAFVMKLLLGEMSKLLLEGQKVIPQRIKDSTQFDFKYKSITQALNDALQH